MIEIGKIGVDSGQLIIGDPCYLESEWEPNESPLFLRHVLMRDKQPASEVPQYYVCAMKVGSDLDQFLSAFGLELLEPEPSTEGDAPYFQRAIDLCGGEDCTKSYGVIDRDDKVGRLLVFYHYDTPWEDGRSANERQAEVEYVEPLAECLEGLGLDAFSYRGCCWQSHSEPHGAGILNYKLGHPGVAAAFSTTYGDGHYPVFADIHPQRKAPRYVIVVMDELDPDEIERLGLKGLIEGDEPVTPGVFASMTDDED